MRTMNDEEGIRYLCESNGLLPVVSKNTTEIPPRLYPPKAEFWHRTESSHRALVDAAPGAVHGTSIEVRLFGSSLLRPFAGPMSLA